MDTPKYDSRCNEDLVLASIGSVWPIGVVHFNFRPQQFEQVVLESEICQKRCAQRMNISSRKGTAESQLHVEVTPAFSGGDSWCYGEIIGSERAGSDRRAKGEEAGQNIVSVFFVGAQKAVFDQQEGIVADAFGRIPPTSLEIRGQPKDQLDRLCWNQF